MFPFTKWVCFRILTCNACQHFKCDIVGIVNILYPFLFINLKFNTGMTHACLFPSWKLQYLQKNATSTSTFPVEIKLLVLAVHVYLPVFVLLTTCMYNVDKVEIKLVLFFHVKLLGSGFPSELHLIVRECPSIIIIWDSFFFRYTRGVSIK